LVKKRDRWENHNETGSVRHLVSFQLKIDIFCSSKKTLNRFHLQLNQPAFLPLTRAEMKALGWEQIDVLLVTGDAYVDHPAFGPALLGRWLVAHGVRVGLVAQPDWRDPDSVAQLGRPRLLAGVTAGALDSMVAHYTAFRKKRSEDAYSPGGQPGLRPNRAAIVYANLIRRAFPGLPLVLGGIEASLRRAVHYDFWSDAIRRSILLDAKADLLIYGMAEQAMVEAVRRLTADSQASLKGIAGTVFAGDKADLPASARVVIWPSMAQIQADPRKLMDAALAMEAHIHRADHWALQQAGGRTLVFAPPAEPLGTAELDRIYGLAYARRPHPSYLSPIPAMAVLGASINTHRGCGGGCSFCSLALHQGRRVQSRSLASILAEASRLADTAGFEGSISDVGGPSAGMWGARCLKKDACRRPSCLVPRICPFFKVNQKASLEMLRAIKRLPGIGHVRVASGLRFDLAMQDQEALSGLLAEFVGGQLKVAPEHICDPVLERMRKPAARLFAEFMDVFQKASQKAGKQQYLVAYLLSAFPGTTDADMVRLARWLSRRGWQPQQVQCFIPTPGTVATAMYHAGIDWQGRPIVVAKTDAARLRQHRLLINKAPWTKNRRPSKPIAAH
jgi:uncharacterized radical SAM protein YgiQ